jgi:hypothetical protein
MLMNSEVSDDDVAVWKIERRLAKDQYSSASALTASRKSFIAWS